jgi:hypothetical protein
VDGYLDLGAGKDQGKGEIKFGGGLTMRTIGIEIENVCPAYVDAIPVVENVCQGFGDTFPLITACTWTNGVDAASATNEGKVQCAGSVVDVPRGHRILY